MRRRRGRRRGRPFAWGPLALAGILAALFLAAEVRVRPFVEAACANAAKACVTEVVEEAVLESVSQTPVSASEMVEFVYDADGGIQAVSGNAQAQARLQAQLVSAIQEKAAQAPHKELSIPLGTLTGLALLHGRGPGVPLRLTMADAVSGELHSSFDAAGINQTRWELTLAVTVSVYTYLPGDEGQQTVTVSVPVAQTVLVGEVPQMLFGDAFGTQ